MHPPSPDRHVTETGSAGSPEDEHSTWKPRRRLDLAEAGHDEVAHEDHDDQHDEQGQDHDLLEQRVYGRPASPPREPVSHRPLAVGLLLTSVTILFAGGTLIISGGNR